jgi:formylglycine-generating enzyme required for sulfatase activity
MSLLVIFLLMTASVSAARAGDPCVPQPNEDCPDAIVLTTADLPFSITAPLGCTNDVIDKPYFDLFYEYQCTQTADHLISMCDSDGDTFFRIYANGCGWTTGIELATADDECPGSPPNADPQLVITLLAGETYWIEIGTWRATPPWAPPPNSPYNLSISLDTGEVIPACDGIGIPMVLVDDPGNSADTSGFGSVASLYRLGLHEVTNREWVGLLNSVAVAADDNGLYNEDMNDSDRGGIIQGGTPGSLVYWVKQSFGDKPVNFVSWLDAARYCNWLHNGMPTGGQDSSTTEDGVYDLSQPLDQISRKSGARFFIPAEDEWYKAAYYDPFDPGADGGGTIDYWLYPTSSDVLPTQATADAVGDIANPGTNVANFDGGADWNGENGNVTTVGGTTTTSPWGNFDMGGNVYEWTETLDNLVTPTRVLRGGDLANNGILMRSSFTIDSAMTVEAANYGFRVAATPCPGDFDGDNDVDEDDAAVFLACFTGAGGGPLDPSCAIGDFDGDDDIDCDDWGQFLLAYTGEAALTGPAECLETVSAVLDCQPDWGILPFSTQIGVTLANAIEFHRTVAGRIDVTLASGTYYPSWRAGYTNLSPGEMYFTVWNQGLPALGTLLGDNLFSLIAADVTPAPYNQPPYPASGDTDTAVCSVTGIAP